MCRLIYYRHERKDKSQNAPWQTLYRYSSSRNLFWVLHTVCPLRCVYELRRVVAPCESSSIRYIQHHEVREKHQIDCNTIFRGRVSKLSSTFFIRSPRTGTKCITSSAASPSCLPISKSDERETVNVAAKNVNTSQYDRWPIVSCWSYSSTLPILGMSPFIRVRSCFYVWNITAAKPSPRCQLVFFVLVRASFIWWCHHGEYSSLFLAEIMGCQGGK